MPTYKTPGVYVEEISTLPPSVAGVSTAIPAFIGYTEKADLAFMPTRIDTMIDYAQLFGGPPDAQLNVTVEEDEIGAITRVEDLPLLYYSLRMYFDNGGGPCYIVSVGGHDDPVTLGDDTSGIKGGLAALKKEDEPTLIVIPDATRLGVAEYYQACIASLNHCGEMKDRFAILDLRDDVDVADFRTNLSSDYLRYGAAYTPYLDTALTVAYEEAKVDVEGVASDDTSEGTFEGTFGGIKVTYTGPADATPSVEIVLGVSGGDVEFAVDETGPKLTITLNSASSRASSTIAGAWAAQGGFDLTSENDATQVGATAETALSLVSSAETEASTVTLASLQASHTGLHSQIKTALGSERVTLPPSSAMAGIYARVDRERGVWKAPANVAVASVIALTQTITGKEQEELNVDPTSGKSVNAIRSFTGRGTLVWGARTLAGNDNEWRYIPVRRLFNMIEESTQKSTAFAVFEPNDATTWLKVKAMIESYLYGLWQQGALAGSTSEMAYFVNVGLGKTMTAQDILEGRMIVEIGIAAVRPAEFIILRFSHKMQEA